MIKYRHYFLIIILAILSNSCAFVQEEIDSIDIKELTTKSDDLKIYQSKTVHIDSGDRLYFWSEIDMEYEGDLNLFFQVEIINDKNEKLLMVELNPLDTDTEIMCVKTILNKKSNYSCTGRIHNFYSTEEEDFDFIDFKDSGEYSFNVIMFANSYDNLDIKKSKLILKI